MLVLQTQAIQFKRRRLALFIRLNHGPTTPRITADRGQAQRKVWGNQPRLDQRAQQRNGTRGVAARIGDAARLGDPLRMTRCQFWKTKHPGRVSSVRGRGVNDLGAQLAGSGGNAVHHGHRLDSGIVMQTQNNQVHLRHQRLFGGGVLAQCGINAHQFDLWHGLQTLANLQAGGACFAVNKYFMHGGGSLVSFSKAVHPYNRALCDSRPIILFWCVAT